MLLNNNRNRFLQISKLFFKSIKFLIIRQLQISQNLNFLLLLFLNFNNLTYIIYFSIMIKSTKPILSTLQKIIYSLIIIIRIMSLMQRRILLLRLLRYLLLLLLLNESAEGGDVQVIILEVNFGHEIIVQTIIRVLLLVLVINQLVSLGIEFLFVDEFWEYRGSIYSQRVLRNRVESSFKGQIML